MKKPKAVIPLRGSHAWLVQTTDGFPAAPPYQIHEMYFSKAVHRVRHRMPFARCTKAVHLTVGSFMN